MTLSLPTRHGGNQRGLAPTQQGAATHRPFPTTSLARYGRFAVYATSDRLGVVPVMVAATVSLAVAEFREALAHPFAQAGAAAHRALADAAERPRHLPEIVGALHPALAGAQLPVDLGHRSPESLILVVEPGS